MDKENGISRMCFGPLYERCEHCKEFPCDKLDWVVRLPHYIVDLMPKMSMPAWNVYCYLHKEANYKINHTFYGRVSRTNTQVEQQTAVAKSNMRIYYKELVELELIRFYYTKRKVDGHWQTMHHFFIEWYFRKRDLDKLKTEKALTR